MNKKLKNYNDFLNESSVAKPKLSKQSLDYILKLPTDGRETIEELRYDLSESVIDMADFFPGWFSDMCKKKDANPEDDYQEMQNLLNKKGWNFESIKNLFSEEVNKLVDKDFIDWFNSYGQLDRKNGHCDVYLYFTAKNLGLNTDGIPLGGDGWAEYNDSNELWIRYKYGYHQTKYGQLMLDSIGYTVKQFKEEALVYLQNYIKEYWEQSLITALRTTLTKQSYGKKYDSRLNLNVSLSKSLKGLISGMDIKKYTLVEEDRMIIFTNEIASIINKEGLASVEAKDIADSLIEQYSWLDSGVEGEGDILQEIDGVVIVWGKFNDFDWSGDTEMLYF
jgi:hypothetical protein